jgi:hypothetical protein
MVCVGANQTIAIKLPWVILRHPSCTTYYPILLEITIMQFIGVKLMN